MLDAVAWIVAGYAALVCAAAALGLALQAPRPRWLDQLAWMLTALAVVLALVGAGALGNGTHPDSVETFVGYLASSDLVMPMALVSIREDRGPWSSGVVAVAALATGVIAVRIMMTQ